MSIDLQEATRRDDVFTELGLIKEKISALPVFPSLMLTFLKKILIKLEWLYLV